jgi:hypothetical protein
MLNRHRRYLAPIAASLLAVPLVVGLIAPDGPAAIFKEGRTLTPGPGWPASGSEWLNLPLAVDAYLKDHFGLRSAMIRAHRELSKAVLDTGSNTVLLGRDGRMFYLGEEAVQQSAGLVLRDERVADTVDFLVEMNRKLAVRGVQMLVATPPNGATVYQEDLPDWAKNPGKPTEYDLLMSGLSQRGVKAVDLRPLMMKTRAEGPTYFWHDSHWTPRGALAAYDAIVQLAAQPEWRLDPATALTPRRERRGGDLARQLNVEDSVTEEYEELAVPPGKQTLLTSDPFGDYVETSDNQGPTIMIFGDSFTARYFAPMALKHAGRVVWIDHKHCAFDWGVIDRFHPDMVWWMPNERQLICDPAVRPVGFGS